MVVGIDQTGHDDAALGVNPFRVRILLLQFGGRADLPDEPPVDGDGAVFEELPLVSCDESAVSDQQHEHIPLLLFGD